MRSQRGAISRTARRLLRAVRLLYCPQEACRRSSKDCMHADWTSVGDDEGHDGFTHSSCAVRFRELPAVSAGASNGEVKLTMSCYQLEAPEQNKQTYALQLTSILVTTHPLLIPLISLLSLCHRSASSFLYSDTPILADKAIPSTEEGMANTSETQDINGPSKRTLQIAFLVCDEPAEPTLRKHGGFHECAVFAYGRPDRADGSHTAV